LNGECSCGGEADGRAATATVCAASAQLAVTTRRPIEDAAVGILAVAVDERDGCGCSWCVLVMSDSARRTGRWGEEECCNSGGDGPGADDNSEETNEDGDDEGEWEEEEEEEEEENEVIDTSCCIALRSTSTRSVADVDDDDCDGTTRVLPSSDML
jgi:hypothetical protein